MIVQMHVAYQRRRDCPRRRFCLGILLPSIIAFALLGGCASMGPPPVTPIQTADSPLASFFTLRARISVRQGDKIESAQIRWAKRPDEERLEVFSPFGSQVAELVKVTNGGVTLRRGRETITADSIGELTLSLFGMPLDMDAIAVWTQGIGLKENESIEQRFANGDLWQVTIERLQTSGIHRFASRLSAIRGDMVVRLVIDEWHAA